MGGSAIETSTRQVRASLFMSLDGVVEAPESWHFPYQNDEMMAAVSAEMETAGAMMLGRRTYEEWARHWPRQPAGDPLADYFNGVTKYVMSDTLDHVGWQNSQLVDGGLDGVRALKREPGADILISGSGTLVGSLLQAGLLDELRVMVHPVVLGKGRRLFEGGDGSCGLSLVESSTFATGVVNLAYRPVESRDV